MTDRPESNMCARDFHLDKQMSPSFGSNKTLKCFEWMMETVCWHNYLSQFSILKPKKNRRNKSAKKTTRMRCGGRERDVDSRKWEKEKKKINWKCVGRYLMPGNSFYFCLAELSRPGHWLGCDCWHFAVVSSDTMLSVDVAPVWTRTFIEP